MHAKNENNWLKGEGSIFLFFPASISCHGPQEFHFEEIIASEMYLCRLFYPSIPLIA
jgi:hypothetical protein